MPSFNEKTVRSTTLYKGRIIDVRIDEVQLPNGEQAKREIVDHKGAVAIIPITPTGKIILVKQFRKALERTIIEIPAGGIELGEELLTTAKRELEEETGYQAARWEQLATFATSPGFANELITVFLATELTLVENPLVGDEDEFIELLEVTIEEAKELIQQEEIFDAKTFYAIQYVEMHSQLGRN